MFGNIFTEFEEKTAYRYWWAGVKLQLDGRNKSWCFIAQQVTIANRITLCVSKQLEEIILNFLTTKKE
jgi:hypothetical protein